MSPTWLHQSALCVPAVLVAVLLLAAVASPAQNVSQNGATHGKRTVRALRTELPITVDGNLDEIAWQEAPISLGFVQRDPQEGMESTERTEFRVVYTATTVYVGVIAYDSDAEGILATDRRRDSELQNDDILSVVFDTFHDHRNGFLFRTNPLGAQYDALITDEGTSVNVTWDELWDVAVQITPAGWITEFAIPFKSLRVPEENGTGWGLELERVIRRKNEFAYWNGYRRGFTLESLSQAGHLSGIEEIETGLRLRIKPYLLGGFTHSVGPHPFETGQSVGNFQSASDAGIEVIKYRVTPSLTADFTWRTDFAQTEVDDQQVNRDRFPQFYPEKREFFQEGAGVFDIGIQYGEARRRPTLKLFHSRQIGLSERRRPVPILGGGRITGRLQGVTLGLMNVQTEALPSEGILPSNYGVMRVKRDVFERSFIGGFVLTTEQGGSLDFNRVYGADANFVFFDHFFATGFLGQSQSPETTKDNWVTAGAVGWDSDRLNLTTAWTVVDPEFRSDLGFVPRKNMRQISPEIAFRPRPNSDFIRQIVMRSRVDYIMNQQNRLESRVTHLAFEFLMENGGDFAFTPHGFRDTVPEPFHIRSGVVIPPGTYSWWHTGARFRTNPANRFVFAGNFMPNWRYYNDGFLLSGGFNTRFRMNEDVALESEYDYGNATLPEQFCPELIEGECGFTDHNVSLRLNYNFNNQWLTSTIVQYNTSEDFFGFNFRLNYIFRPGDDFFLIYNEGRLYGGPFDGHKDRTLQTKLTHSFDF